MSGKWIARAVIGAVLTAGLSARAVPEPAQAADAALPRYAVQGGTIAFDFDLAVLDAVGLGIYAHGHLDEVSGAPRIAFGIEPSSTLTVEADRGAYAGIVGGVLRTRGAFLLDKPGEHAVMGNLAIEVDSRGAFVVRSTLGGADASHIAFELDSVLLDFSAQERSLWLIGELSIARTWAPKLETPGAVGAVIGTIVIEAHMVPIGDASLPTIACEAEDVAKDVSRSGEFYPDVVVADLYDIGRFPDEVEGVTAFAVATNACNVGTARASWIAGTNEHPVIAQDAYRLMDDRFEQIGMSWVKHGFYAVAGSLCTPCNDPTDGTELGVGCSDPYSAHLNGLQSNMSPRSIVNTNTGYFPYPWSVPAPETLIERRLQIHDTDLDPALNPGARYFVQGHYVTPGDCLARTHNNNASYREVEALESEPGSFTLQINSSWSTRSEQPAIRAWLDVDPAVKETDIQIQDEGLFILAAKVIDLGSGTWRYEYALQNLNSERSARSFSVPYPDGVVVTNIGFHDIDYHSGDPYDPTDWVGVAASNAVTWSSQPYDPLEEANALRWGTVYNFFFDSNARGDPGTVTIGLFKPLGTEDEITGESFVPTSSLIDCNGNSNSDACDISCDAPGCGPPCGTSGDCDLNGVPDECQADCNDNDEPDACEILAGTSPDCNGNDVPDECEVDCNLNGVTDWCDINTDETSEDCNGNEIPDECEIDENTLAPGGPFFCTQDCDPDCDNSGIPDECEADVDHDGDRVFGCDDLCPHTNPGVTCACGELEDCCFPQYGYCYSDYNLEPIPPVECEGLGGVPLCNNLSPICRYGCLVGDVDDSGLIDLKDVAGLLLCFRIEAADDDYAECLRLLDYDEDGYIDLTDYEILADLLLNGIP